MSTIFGIYNLSGEPASEPILHRIEEDLAFYGPDGSAVWNMGSVGLGHCMLHITPESMNERLPFVSGSGRFAITAEKLAEGLRHEPLPLCPCPA